MVRKRKQIETTGPFEEFLVKLWNLWREDVGRAVLLARYRWQDIPETVTQQAEAIQQQANAYRESSQIDQQVNVQLGMLGISPSCTGGSYLGGGGVDPGMAMFLMTMSIVRQYKGGPAIPPRSGALVSSSEAVLRGEIDPIQAVMDAATPAERQQLQMVITLLQSGGEDAYNYFRVQAIVMIAFALPRERIPALLPELQEEYVPVPEMGIRPVSEATKWLVSHKDQLSRGQLTALDVLNAFAFGGRVNEDSFRAALAHEKKLSLELVLSKEVAITAEVELPAEPALTIAEVPDAWFHEGNTAAAKTVFVALSALTRNAYFENMLGACDHVLGAHEDALAHYERALAYDPDYLSARLNHANELISLQRNEEGILELAKLSLLHSTEEEQQTAHDAREKLDALWAFILEHARTDKDSEQRIACISLYNTVRQAVAKLGVELPELWTREEQQQSARRILNMFREMKLPLTEEQIEELETKAGVKSKNRGAA